MKKYILIDGSGLIYRGFYAIPPFFKSPKGIQTNAVYGFTSILLTLIERQKPDYVAVAFDKKGPTFRHKEYKEYKATRVKAPDELYAQIPIVKDVVKAFGIPGFEIEGYEADDIIATIAKKLVGRKDIELQIATGDFDMFQLVRDGVSVLYPEKGFKGASVFRTEEVIKKYELTPGQVVDYKALAGDSSDNIPGVYGIGEKGAKTLLRKYKTLDGIYEHIDEIGGATQKKLIAGKEDAVLSRRLAMLCPNVPLEFDLQACALKSFDVESVRSLFGDLGFNSLRRRLGELSENGSDKPVQAKSITKPEAGFMQESLF